MADGALIYVVLGVLKLMHGMVNQDLELLLPAVVQFVEAGVPLDAVLGQRGDEVLASLRVLLGLQPR